MDVNIILEPASNYLLARPDRFVGRTIREQLSAYFERWTPYRAVSYSKCSLVYERQCLLVDRLPLRLVVGSDLTRSSV